MRVPPQRLTCVLLTLGLLLGGSAAAGTTSIDEGIPTLARAGGILDTLYGLENLERLSDYDPRAGDQRWVRPGRTDVHMEVHYATVSTRFDLGFYANAHSTEFVSVMEVTAASMRAGRTSASVTPAASVAGLRLAILTSNAHGKPRERWLSTPGENADLYDHMVSWRIARANADHPGNSVGAYVVAWEDAARDVSDFDYNDLVVEISGLVHAACPNDAYCDDDNPCTDDICDDDGGCRYENNTAPCWDGDVCNGMETCSEGACVAGPAMVCDDDNPCTDDTCEARRGCVYHNNDAWCTDGDACNGIEICAGGECRPGEALACDDGDLCNGVESCDAVQGCVTSEPLHCDDGNACTQDFCDAILGCRYLPMGCNDGNACTDDLCHPVLGCRHLATDCDDGNVCTDDVCAPETGCAHLANSAPCGDGDFCNGDETCSDGVCSAGEPPSCNDRDVCNGIETCDPVLGCLSGEPLTCDDDNVCTENMCDAMFGCRYPPSSCSDGNPCTYDTCDGQLGCLHTTISCDDDNPCTDDTCDFSSGCVHEANTATCSDGDVCNGLERCDAGSCQAGTPPDCDDGTVCTDEVCDADLGCVYTPATCDDGDACTIDFCNPTAGCASVIDPVCGDCPQAPRLVAGFASCTVGEACDIAISMEAGGVDVASAAATVSLGEGIACGKSCTAGDQAAGASCFISSQACTFAVADLAPPISAFADGEVAVLSLTCTEPGQYAVALDEVSLGTTIGANVGDACGRGVLLDCEMPFSCEGVVCDDGDPCTDDACDPMTGLCQAAPLCDADCQLCEHGECIGLCGNPFAPGESEVTLDDAFTAVLAAVELVECRACICDVSGDGQTTALDALQMLRYLVGLDVAFQCPLGAAATTTTTTTSTTTSTTTTLDD